MKKNILALSIGAVLAASSVAVSAAEVKVYGKAHLSYEQISVKSDSLVDLSSNSSRLGFKAKETVVEGLEAMMQLEQEIRFDRRNTTTGDDKVNGDTFTTRDSFVGLKGNFGMVRLGYFDTPTKKVRSATDMFGDRIGDARNLTSGMSVKADERFNNGVHYQTPSMAGFTLDAQFTANNDSGAGNSLTAAKKEGYSIALTYKANDLTVMIAQEKIEDGVASTAAVDDPVISRLGVTYNVAKGFKVAGFFQDTLNGGGTKNKNNTVMGVGAYYDIADGYRLRGQYYTASKFKNVANSEASMMAVGVDRKIGKSLTLYAAYAATDNGKAGTYSVTAGGHGTQVTPGAGLDASALALGVIYDF